MSDSKPEKKEGEEKKKITVKVNYNNDLTVFQVKKSTRFRKIFDAFYKNKGISRNTVQFTFDGESLTEEQTPDDVQMEDGDIGGNEGYSYPYGFYAFWKKGLE